MRLVDIAIGGGEGRAAMGVGEKLGRAPVLSHAPVGDGDGAGQERVGGGGIAILKRIWEMMVGSGDDGGDGGKVVAVGVGEEWCEVVGRVVRRVHVVVEAGRGKVCGVGVGMLARDGEVAVLGSGNGGGEGNGNGGEISGMDI